MLIITLSIAAAQKVERPSSTSKSWILTSTLPLAYRTPAILPPTRAPSSFQDSTYTAIYTFLISIITLSGGSIAEQKLDRYLRRMNADTYTPVDRTDRLLQRLCKDGYLIRNREMDGGEEVIEYMVGPRGKIEVGESGVEGMVREVYGQNSTTSSSVPTRGTAANTAREAEQRDDFERRLERSLTSSRRDRPAPPAPPAPPAAANGERTEDGEKDGGAQNGGQRAGQGNTRRRSTRGRGNRGDSMDEDSD
jgi:melanoma-associated antigen